MELIKHRKEYNSFLNKCEAVMADIGLVKFPLKHIFSDGIYMREMFIPKGGWLTSMVHKTEYPYMLNAGILDLMTEEGTIRLLAPYTGISKLKARKMGLAIEDCIFTSIHANPDNCTDIPTLEKRLFKVYKNPLLKGKTMEALKK